MTLLKSIVRRFLFRTNKERYFRNGYEMKPPFWKNDRILKYSIFTVLGTATYVYFHIEEVPITRTLYFVYLLAAGK